MNHQLTKGHITKSLLFFSLPMILGNLLQQFYNIADTFIVGQYLGSHGSSWIIIYDYDFFNIYHFRLMYGEWNFIFNVVWSQRS